MTELNAVASVLVGSTPADAVYLGSNQIWTAVVPAVVTGGQTVTDSGFVYHVFTSSGTLTIADAPVEYPEVFVVAGGGGGGRSGSGGAGGGGGAGGLLYYAPSSLSEGTYSIIVGGGGAGTSTSFTSGVSGSNSSFAAQTAIGGGGGGSGSFGSNPLDGGSGGGGGTGSGPNTYQAQGVPGQGNAGGLGANLSPRIGGGGGGYASPGENATDRAAIPAGGSGLAILGTAYAQGGQGSNNNIRVAGNAGQINTGCGGDGGPSTIDGAAGGSGAVIVRYQSAVAVVDVPDSPVLTLSGGYLLTLNWSEPASNGSIISGYVLEISTDNSTWSTVYTGAPRTAEVFVGDYANSVVYFRVSAINAAGQSNPSEVVTHFVPDGVSVDFVLAAGGGGGGSQPGAGGGGAGGVLIGLEVCPKNTGLPIVIGSGGGQGTNGSNSFFYTYETVGGGAGARGAVGETFEAPPFAGGSGGGGGVGATAGNNTGGPANPGGQAQRIEDGVLIETDEPFGFREFTTGEGWTGGGGVMCNLSEQIRDSNAYSVPTSGGGGGFGGPGGHAQIVARTTTTSTANCGAGGLGLTISDFGTPLTIAGGGGGGAAVVFGTNFSYPGAGGSGVGGSGGNYSNGNGGNAAPNTASGGGGSGGGGTGGAGSSGICLLKVPSGVSAQFSAGVSYTTESITGYTVYKVTSAGPSSTVTFV